VALHSSWANTAAGQPLLVPLGLGEQSKGARNGLRLDSSSTELPNRTNRPDEVDPKRREPFMAQSIVLENGATTFVWSLEDFLASQTSTTEVAPNGTMQTTDGPRPDEQGEREREPTTAEPTSRPTSSASSTLVAPVVADPEGKSSKLAILFGFDTQTERPKGHKPEGHKPEGEKLEGERPEGQKAAEEQQGGAVSEGPAHPKEERHQQESGEHQKHPEHKEHGSHGHSSRGAHNGSSTGPKPILQHWQIKSLLNVTHDYPLAYSQIICGYVWPLMAAITLFTNLMIVFVLTQRDMRTPTNVVLIAIAIADIIPIVVPVPWFVYLFAMGNEKQVLYPPIVCYFYQHSTRSISEIFYFLSTWLNVLLAIQDYLVACHPQLAKKYCQIRVVILEIIMLTLFAFLLNLPQALKLVFKPVKFYYQNQLTWGCKALQAKWFKDLVGEYAALYDDIFTAIIVVFVDGGPAIVLITLTALLIRQLQRQRIKGHLLMEQARTASKRRRERHRQQEYESSARVMIFVLLAFLAVKIPFATTYTLMIIQSRFEVHFVENLVDFQKAISITDLVFVLSYPINFTIFCCCSKKFRHKCAQLLSECSNKNEARLNRGRKFMSSISSSINGNSFVSSVRRFSSSFSERSRDSTASANCVSANQTGWWSASSLSKQQIEHLRQLRQANARQASLGSIEEEKSRDRMMLADGDERATLLGNRNPSMVPNGLFETSGRASGPGGGPLMGGSGEPSRAPRPEDLEGAGRADEAISAGESAAAGVAARAEPEGGARSPLEDGSLCVECILRYEQMRARLSGGTTAQTFVAAGPLPPEGPDPQLSGRAGSVVSELPLGSWAGDMGAVTLASVWQQQQQQQARRASQISDSSSGISWPGMQMFHQQQQQHHQIPPGLQQPLSLISLQHHHQQQQQQQQQRAQQQQNVPQIITTTCESIREQSSQEEESSLAEVNKQQNEEESKLKARDQENTDSAAPWSSMSNIGTGSPVSHQDESSLATEGQCAGQSEPTLRHQVSSASDQSEAPLSRPRNEQLTPPAAAYQASGSSAGEKRGSAWSAGPQFFGAHDGRHKSDPAALGLGRTISSSEGSANGLRQVRRQFEVRSSYSASSSHERGAAAASSTKSKAASDDDHRLTSDSSGAGRSRLRHQNRAKEPEDSSSGSMKMMDRQRSLSLSNSNLTTLPNATGLLADVLVGALLSASGQPGCESNKPNEKKKSKGARRWIKRGKK